MDSVMRYVSAISLLDYLFDDPCSGILLFVDFPKLAGYLTRQGFSLDVRTSLVPMALCFSFNVPRRCLLFGYLLSSPVFARIMYLTLAAVSFKTLFILPLPMPPRSA